MITSDFSDIQIVGDDSAVADAPPEAPETPTETPAPVPTPEPEPEEETAPEAAQTPQTRYGSKIARLKGEAEAAKQEKSALEERMEALQAKIDAMSRRSAPDPSGDFAFPSIEQWFGDASNAGKTFEQYQDARTDARFAWLRRQQDIAHYEGQLRTNYQSGIRAAKQLYPDFDAAVKKSDDAVNAGQLPRLGVELSQAILESEVGPRLTYFFATNPEEYVRFTGLRGRELVKAVAKLEGRLEAVGTGSARTTPNSSPKPAPISPVGSSGALAAESSAEDDDSDGLVNMSREAVWKEIKAQRQRRLR